MPVSASFTIAMPLDATPADVDAVARIICDRMFLEEFEQQDSPTDVCVTGTDEEIQGCDERQCNYRAYRHEDGTWRVKPKSEQGDHRFSF